MGRSLLSIAVACVPCVCHQTCACVRHCAGYGLAVLFSFVQVSTLCVAHRCPTLGRIQIHSIPHTPRQAMCAANVPHRTCRCSGVEQATYVHALCQCRLHVVHEGGGQRRRHQAAQGRPDHVPTGPAQQRQHCIKAKQSNTKLNQSKATQSLQSAVDGGYRLRTDSQLRWSMNPIFFCIPSYFNQPYPNPPILSRSQSGVLPDASADTMAPRWVPTLRPMLKATSPS